MTDPLVQRLRAGAGNIINRHPISPVAQTDADDMMEAASRIESDAAEIARLKAQLARSCDDARCEGQYEGGWYCSEAGVQQDRAERAEAELGRMKAKYEGDLK